MAAQQDGWADPARLTGPGRRSAVLLAAARSAVAEQLQVRPDEISFVASGVQAIQLAVLGTLAARRRVGPVLVHSAVEHSAVFQAADWHRDRVRSAAGRSDDPVRVVGVDSEGRVDADEFVMAASQAGVAAAVLQAANHEVGTRQPVADVARRLQELGVPLVVDASQEVLYGRPPIPGAVLAADARLWGGPAGVGILVIRTGTRWQSPFPTDGVEGGRAAGSVAVPAIVAAAAALRAFRADRRLVADRLRGLSGDIRDALPTLVADLVVLGSASDRLPHIVTFSTLHVDGETVLTGLDRRGFAVSSGSSCTSDALTPSHVLVAMGALSGGNVRLSLHPGTTEAEVAALLAVLPEVIADGRAALEPAAAAAPAASDDLVIDSRGRRCPLPVLDLARRFDSVPVGGEVTVLADDPAAATDLAAWSRLRDQEFLGDSDHGDGASAYRIRRLH